MISFHLAYLQSHTHPFLGIEIQVFDFSMLKETRQTDAIVGQMGFFSNDNNVVLSPLDIILYQFLTVGLSAHVPLIMTRSKLT
jgi:hypothetical protein